MASNTRANTKNIPAPTNIGFQDFGYFLSKNTRKKIGKPKAIIPCIMIEIIVPPLTIGTPLNSKFDKRLLGYKKNSIICKNPTIIILHHYQAKYDSQKDLNGSLNQDLG